MTARFGRYELLRPLGRGGMAELFLARYRGPEGIEKSLVIKRVAPELAGDHRLLALFFEEARIQVSLSHGNLVPAFDFGRVGNAYFIAMEHVPGRDLGALLAAARDRGRRLPPRLSAYVCAEVCRGLAYVHRRGLVHRDVTPRNILLSWDGEVRLSDFGVALSPADRVAPGVRGTLGYMAPEQALGKRPDQRADLFALGLVLAEAVSGQRAREAANPEAALAAARTAAPLSIEGRFAEVVTRATAPLPEDRFADAEALQIAIEQVAAQLPPEKDAQAPAHALAALLSDWFGPPDPQSTPGEVKSPVGETQPHEETYFRDARTADSFEQLLLGSAQVRGASTRRRWIIGAVAIAGAAALAITGAAIAARARRPVAPTSAAAAARAPAAEAPAAGATAATPSIGLSPAPLPVSPTASSASTAPATPPPARAGVHAPGPHRPMPAPGTLTVRCTPWCVPYLDDRPRGEGGRRHTLTLPAGRHRVAAQRLDDRQERTVEIRARQSQAIDFAFP